jgi:hypothetical protein
MPYEWALLTELEGQPLAWQLATKPYRDAPVYVGPGLAFLFPDGGEDDAAQLESMTIDGEGFGDTWHLTRTEAKEAALDWWGDHLGPWHAISASVADPRAYALAAARAQLGLVPRLHSDWSAI